MVGLKTRQFVGSYSGCGGSSLWRGLASAVALTLAFGCGGCSLGQFDSLSGDRTGSITPPPGTKQVSDLPPDSDLVFTKAAVSEVLSRPTNDASVPWENPHSGARGTVTPIAAAYNLDGQTCRDFLASSVQGRSQAWLQGEACKQPKGDWEVRSFKPWKRS